MNLISIYQSEWTRVTQPLSCPALLNLKSGREELHFTWSQSGESVFYLSNALSEQHFHFKQYSHFQRVTAKQE